MPVPVGGGEGVVDAARAQRFTHEVRFVSVEVAGRECAVKVFVRLVVGLKFQATRVHLVGHAEFVGDGTLLVKRRERREERVFKQAELRPTLVQVVLDVKVRGKELVPGERGESTAVAVHRRLIVVEGEVIGVPRDRLVGDTGVGGAETLQRRIARRLKPGRWQRVGDVLVDEVTAPAEEQAPLVGDLEVMLVEQPELVAVGILRALDRVRVQAGSVRAAGRGKFVRVPRHRQDAEQIGRDRGSWRGSW